MLNTGIASAISLRTRGSFSFTTNEYTHCPNGRSRFACSSSTPWCSCCCNSIYAMPSCPNYGSNLYGLKQSSLIQWSCYGRPISGGFDYYARLPACDIDRMCYCDQVCNFSEGSVGRRRGGLNKRFVYGERSERYDLGGVDEAEAMLSLLTDDLGEECLLVTKETRRLVRKPEMEKRENGDVCRECGSKKKRIGVGVLKSETGREHGSVVSSRNDDSRRRMERIQCEENELENLREDQEGSSLTNRREEREEEEDKEREALLRKAGQKSEQKLARESMRKQNWKLSSRMEEKEELLRREHRQTGRKYLSRTEERDELMRREEHRQKLRRDGSSCSSYYTVSSNGDYDSGNEVELMEGNYLEDSSTGFKNYSTNSELIYQDSREEDQRREDYGEEHGSSLVNRSSLKEFHTGSGVVESDFRKKSEKRLVDTSVEEKKSIKETSLKESNSTMTYQRNRENFTNYASYDDKKEKSTESMRYDEDRKQQLQQTGGEVSRQSETMLKHKQFVQSQNIRCGNVIDTTGSQKVYSRKGEMSAKVSSSNQQLKYREEDYHRSSRKASEKSEIQEIDIRKTSTSQQHFETNIKRDDHSTSVMGYIDNAKHQQQYDQVTGQVELRGKSQKLIEKGNKSILKRETNEQAEQVENVNLASASSSESKKTHSSVHVKITKSGRSRNESDELNKVLVTHSGNTGVILVEDRNKKKSEIPARPSPDLPQIGTISSGSTAGIVIDDAVNGSLLVESTTLHGSDVQGSVAINPEPYGGATIDTSHGQPLRLISDGDAIGSAPRLDKSSTYYVGEFDEQVRSEILISEAQMQKETYKTKILLGECSGDPHSNEQELVRDNQQSGTKGPSDDMWNVDEPPSQPPLEAEVQDNASNDSDIIVKRTGKSLWNIIADIARLRWSHSESHSSGRKTGGRSSPNQSMSSEKWFSGHDADENEETLEEIESTSSIQDLYGSHQPEKTGSQIEESPSSSTLEGRLRHAGIDAPSSSVTLERRPLQPSISLRGGSGHTSSATIIDSSIPSPALRLRRSPAIQRAPEAGDVQASGSGITEKVEIGLAEQTESMVDEREVKQKKLQRKDQVVRDRFDEWEEAYRLEAEQRKVDEMFMREALLEAQKAADNWEVPVGAVLVQNGKIIARGCNLVEELRDSTAHAEIICIREASNKLRTWRLSETTLYVTLEPCPMCAGAILQARIDTLVWGAPNKLLGADGSWIRLFPGDGGNVAEQSDKPPAPVHPFHPKMSIRRGVLASECADAMQQFFKRRRKKDQKPNTSPKTPSCLPISNRPSNFMAKMHDAFSLMFCL